VRKMDGTGVDVDDTNRPGALQRLRIAFVTDQFGQRFGGAEAYGVFLMQELAQRHDVVAVRLFDPLELSLPDVGLITLRDPETGEQLHVDTQDRGFRQRYADLAEQREAQLRQSLARAGVDTLELATDDDVFDALLRFMHLRGMRLRRGSAMRAA